MLRQTLSQDKKRILYLYLKGYVTGTPIYLPSFLTLDGEIQHLQPICRSKATFLRGNRGLFTQASKLHLGLFGYKPEFIEN